MQYIVAISMSLNLCYNEEGENERERTKMELRNNCELTLHMT